MAKPRRIIDPITDLEAHFRNLNNNIGPTSKKIIDVEFDFIEEKTRALKIPCVEAEKEYNLNKNRWPDVLPPDDTRVKLKPVSEEPGSDYVNASFILSSNGISKGYVCSQGPMENTINDFWRLCWDHKINVFTMLTKEEEKGQVKSAKYWPDEKNVPKKYGFIEVTMIKEEKDDVNELTTREFLIKNEREPDEKERKLLHYQYTGWPDHGLPPSTQPFFDLMEKVDLAIEERGGLIGLHCSAGIGRTGTFCAIHINIKLIRENFRLRNEPPYLNLVNTVYTLRKQRPGMVQTKDQFFFCYRAILDEYLKQKELVKQKIKN